MLIGFKCVKTSLTLYSRLAAVNGFYSENKCRKFSILLLSTWWRCVCLCERASSTSAQVCDAVRASEGGWMKTACSISTSEGFFSPWVSPQPWVMPFAFSLCDTQKTQKKYLYFCKVFRAVAFSEKLWLIMRTFWLVLTTSMDCLRDKTWLSGLG